MKVIGLGFRAAAPQASLAEAVQSALSQTADNRADALATVPHKAAAPAIQSLAVTMGLPVWAVDVAGQDTPTQSARIVAGFETGSLAEAAALVAAGPGARLIVGRVVSADGMATVAIAERKGLGQ